MKCLHFLILFSVSIVIIESKKLNVNNFQGYAFLKKGLIDTISREEFITFLIT